MADLSLPTHDGICDFPSEHKGVPQSHSVVSPSGEKRETNQVGDDALVPLASSSLAKHSIYVPSNAWYLPWYLSSQKFLPNHVVAATRQGSVMEVVPANHKTPAYSSAPCEQDTGC